MLGYQLTCQAEPSVCEHVGAPDPLLTQGGPVTFLACALHQLFITLCGLAHHGPYCSHVHVCTHHSSPQHLPVRCLPSLSFCAHMDELQGMRLPLGTTGWNHSYNTSNSLSAVHSLQQLQAGATSPSPVQMSASTRESHGAALSSSVSCPQVTLSATHPQVQMGPTRTLTSDLLSATLAEAATQLSFVEFLERCNLLIAPPPRPQPSPLRLQDAATQTFPHSAASADATTQLPLTEFFLGCIYSKDPLDRSVHHRHMAKHARRVRDPSLLCS